MSDAPLFSSSSGHDHFFLGADHDANERRTWLVIVLCCVMMAAEIGGGLLWGSIALVADGLHMSTHAGALLLTALAYRYARRYAHDERFCFGTGKLGDLAGFSSAIILAMISILIAYEAVSRFIWPVAIHFREAIPIAVLGLLVNVASVFLLSGGHEHHHGHSHGHSHGAHGHADHAEDDDDDPRSIALPDGALSVEIFETGVPPRFRIRFENGAQPRRVTLETERPDGARQTFHLEDRGAYFESLEEVPEPHAFALHVAVEQGAAARLEFSEHDHGHDHAGSHGHRATERDNNMRSALVHILADGGVSLFVIFGLLLARSFGWVWMDPIAGLVGSVVIALWSYSLIRDTGAILLDMTPDREMERSIRRMVESEGDRLTDLHVWRLGPGHLGAIVCIETMQMRGPQFYRQRFARLRALSHVTIEIESLAAAV